MSDPIISIQTFGDSTVLSGGSTPRSITVAAKSGGLAQNVATAWSFASADSSAAELEITPSTDVTVTYNGMSYNSSAPLRMHLSPKTPSLILNHDFLIVSSVDKVENDPLMNIAAVSTPRSAYINVSR